MIALVGDADHSANNRKKALLKKLGDTICAFITQEDGKNALEITIVDNLYTQIFSALTDSFPKAAILWKKKDFTTTTIAIYENEHNKALIETLRSEEYRNSFYKTFELDEEAASRDPIPSALSATSSEYSKWLTSDEARTTAPNRVKLMETQKALNVAINELKSKISQRSFFPN